ncbi:MAG: hypothetical protein IPI43_00575 [Sandaracinaceae bacterium]|nr:hypothetical protein [Sandaracinaceae bacterium]
MSPSTVGGGAVASARGLALLALGDGQQLGHALVQLCELVDELSDLLSLLRVLSLKCGDIDHGDKRSRP